MAVSTRLCWQWQALLTQKYCHSSSTDSFWRISMLCFGQFDNNSFFTYESEILTVANKYESPAEIFIDSARFDFLWKWFLSNLPLKIISVTISNSATCFCRSDLNWKFSTSHCSSHFLRLMSCSISMEQNQWEKVVMIHLLLFWSWPLEPVA